MAALRLACAVALLAAAAADYRLTHNFNSAQRTCAGAPDQAIAEYLGCTPSPDKTLSYSVRCLNMTAFLVSYYRGESCGGAVVYELPVSWTGGCVAGNKTMPSTSSVCMSGAYVAPPGAINSYVFSPPNVCPLEGLHFFAVLSQTKGCHTNAAGGGVLSFTLGCNSANVTGTPFASKDCTGAPLSPPVPVMALGCAVSPNDSSGPTFTTCGSTPPPEAVTLAIAAEGSGAGAAGDAARAAVLEGVAHAAARAAAAVREATESALRAGV
jgi:hypothetical protein